MGLFLRRFGDRRAMAGLKLTDAYDAAFRGNATGSLRLRLNPKGAEPNLFGPHAGIARERSNHHN